MDAQSWAIAWARCKQLHDKHQHGECHWTPINWFFWNPSLSLFLLIKAGHMVINQRICGDLNIDTRGVFFCVCCSSRPLSRLLKGTSPNSTTRSSNSRPTFWRRYVYHIDYHIMPPILTKNWVATCSMFNAFLGGVIIPGLWLWERRRFEVKNIYHLVNQAHLKSFT